MELLQLKYFCTVAETNNISRAAQIHSIVQPAMSKTIANLEKELDVKLFARTGNRIQLNEAGRLFYEKAHSALDSLQDGIFAVKDQNQPLSGEIGLLVLEHRRLVTECIVEFREKNPDVTFQIYHGFYGKEPARYDLCVSALPPKNSLTSHVRLLKEPILLAVSANHHLSRQKSATVSELSQERFISLPQSNSIYQISLSLCRENGFEPKIAIVCDDPYYVRKYVSLGLGVCFVPTISWEGQFDSNIVLLPLTETECFRTTSVYWDSSRYLSRAAKAFKELLLLRFRNQRETFQPH